MKKITFNNVLAIALIAFVLLSVGYVAFKYVSENAADSGADKTAALVASQVEPDKVVVYYFYGTARCDSCMKIEAYTKEAVESGFPEALKEGKLEWRPLNAELSENQHFIKDYGLYTRTVVVSDMKNGNQTDWKKLDEVWNLIGDKDRFMTFIQDNVRTYLEDQ
ncbi:MAG: nitrophenyl compound nitroreductase subunit ArsF family protein [Methanocella sp.]